MAATRAQQNRSIRQEALREQLAAKGLESQVFVTIKKLDDLDTPLDATEVARLKAANEQRLKLMNKYLPDLRNTELTGEGGGEIGGKWVIEFVNASPQGQS